MRVVVFKVIGKVRKWMMETMGDHAGTENDPVGTANKFESAEWYLYYRRCTQLRKNGEQCKGPAMKGETVCYSHFNQAELKRFRNQQRKNFLGALFARAGAGSRNEIGQALGKISSALFRGHIDEKTAGKLILEVQNMMVTARRREQLQRSRG